MRGVYEATVAISALAATKTLMYITAPSNKVVEILSARVTNTSNETNEQLECTIQKITTLGTPTATTLTPTPRETGDQAAGSTVKGDCTSEPTTYTSGVEAGRQGFPSIAGWHYQPIPGERLVIGGGASWGLLLLTTTCTAFDAMATVTFREIG